MEDNPPHATTHARNRSLRDREVHRFYECWLSAHGSTYNVANNVESIAQAALHGAGYRPHVSQDRALSAFCQLAAFRLHATRATVSLIDATTQYVLAEGTRGAAVAESKDLWQGTAVLPRNGAMGEHCMENTAIARDYDGRTFTGVGLIIPDCRLDDRFKDRPYVISEQGTRFYAGVPIVSRTGIMLGTYAVFDEKPRTGMSIAELKFMQETAGAVMEHLEWSRDRVDKVKGDRIVRGMASFIEGCTSVHGAFGQTGLPSHARGTKHHDSTNPHRSSKKHDPHHSHSTHHASATLPKDNGEPTKSKDNGEPTKSGPNAPPSPTQRNKADSTSSVFLRAVTILRESTLADGVAIFAATSGSTSTKSSNETTMAFTQANPQFAPSTATEQRLSRPGLGGASRATSESNIAPGARPCKVLAYALADDRARAEIEQGSILTLETLEKYFALFPRGKVFYFTDTGLGLNSGDETSAGEDDVESSSTRHRKPRPMDHKELLKKIPAARNVVFIPLYDIAEEKVEAGCFLWTSVTGRMINLDDDLSYLRAFGDSIMSEVARLNVQKNESAKTTFIASMSHELRSPLHGILGAAEFLVDTATDSYQAGLIMSIATCGKTLLDTLNHVLDYSKINKLGRTQMRRNERQNKLVRLHSDTDLESITLTAEVDLGVLVEEVVEAVCAGHAFAKLQSSVDKGRGLTGQGWQLTSADASTAGQQAAKSEGNVSVLLDIEPKASWLVRTQAGALRRIIMNLVTNALKYTSSGFVAIALRASKETDDDSKVNALVRVVDSGKGMSDDFQKNSLFVAFSQEDAFQPGTGLGLNIVKQIVDSLGGTIQVKSQQHVGTEVDVSVSLTAAINEPKTDRPAPDDLTRALVPKVRGRHMVLLDPWEDRPKTESTSRLQETLREVCEQWFEMRVTKATIMDRLDADFYLYSEPPPVDALAEEIRLGGLKAPSGRKIPLILVCLNAESAIAVSRSQSKRFAALGGLVEVIAQPCGPRKLATALGMCLKRMQDTAETSAANGEEEYESAVTSALDAKETRRAGNAIKPAEGYMNEDTGFASPRSQLQRQIATDNIPRSITVELPSPPPLDPETPTLERELRFSALSLAEPSEMSESGEDETPLHILVVDDNHINLHLLTTFMKRNGYEYAAAVNGLEAVQKYREGCSPPPQLPEGITPPKPFDYVLIDINMPVMNGIEATKQIRELERVHQVKPAGIFALTGSASEEARNVAEEAGVDRLLSKPVKFANLQKLLVRR
ncbi:hypothetical protein LTR27_004165 [Elasticomyces elasticus]|nr:hypothetical protein LTR27_004165 [Elasticomyces elasticus]